MRRSWLSREILAFGAFAGTASLYPLLLVLGRPTGWTDAASWTSVVTGLVAVGCSAVLYAVTGRRWWCLRTTAARFAGTVVVAGALGVATILALVEPDRSYDVVHRLIWVGGLAIVVALVVPFLPLMRPGNQELVDTRRLLARISSNGTSHRTRSHSIACMWVTSPTSERGKAGSTWRP